FPSLAPQACIRTVGILSQDGSCLPPSGRSEHKPKAQAKDSLVVSFACASSLYPNRRDSLTGRFLLAAKRTIGTQARGASEGFARGFLRLRLKLVSELRIGARDMSSCFDPELLEKLLDGQL